MSDFNSMKSVIKGNDVLCDTIDKIKASIFTREDKKTKDLLHIECAASVN